MFMKDTWLEVKLQVKSPWRSLFSASGISDLFYTHIVIYLLVDLWNVKSEKITNECWNRFLSWLHALNRDNTVCFNVTASLKVSIIFCSIHILHLKKYFTYWVLLQIPFLSCLKWWTKDVPLSQGYFSFCSHSTIRTPKWTSYKLWL